MSRLRGTVLPHAEKARKLYHADPTLRAELTQVIQCLREPGSCVIC